MFGALTQKLRFFILCIYYNCKFNIRKDYFSQIVHILFFAINFCIVFTNFGSSAILKECSKTVRPPLNHGGLRLSCCILFYFPIAASCDLVWAFSFSTLAMLRIISFTMTSSWEFSL